MTATFDIEFNPSDHTYKVDGEPMPAVSRIIQIAHSYVPKELLQAGADRGIKVHDACEAVDAGFTDDVDPSVKGYADAYQRFLEETGFQVTHSEYRVANPPSRYAGTIDRVGLLGGDVMVIDLKSGKLLPWHWLQLAAYQYAYWLMHGEAGGPLPKGAILALTDGDYRLHESRDPESAFAAFLGLARYHRWKESQK